MRSRRGCDFEKSKLMTSRNQSLDVLRGIAVLLVIVSHYSGTLPRPSALLETGWVGVDLFFVLSGFLISGLLFSEFEKTGTINLKRFWIRRGFKIYPPFYALIGLTALVALVRTRQLPHQLIWEATFLQNYFSRFWPHTWSLAVEEHFYFSLPLLFLLLMLIGKGKPNPFRAIPIISLGLCLLCLYLRILALRHGGDWGHIAFPTHLRMDALFAGVTLGYYAHFTPESFREAGKSWVLGFGLFFAATFVIMPDVPRLTFAYVAFSFIVAWAVNRPSSKNPLAKGLQLDWILFVLDISLARGCDARSRATARALVPLSAIFPGGDRVGRSDVEINRSAGAQTQGQSFPLRLGGDLDPLTTRRCPDSGERRDWRRAGPNMNSLARRNQSLDVLRGAAILLVLCDHYVIPDRSFMKLGGIGVDLFFVLSGFLISGLLFSELRKTGAIHVGRFLIRRGLKIYPAFYLFLFLTSPIVMRTLPSFKWRLAGEVFFLQPYREHLWEHTWSLGVEEHFYLLLPIFLLVLNLARRMHFIPWIALALAFLCSIGRVLTASAPSNTHLRIDELFDGVLLGYLLHHRSSVFHAVAGWRWLLPVGLLLLVPWFAGDVENIGGIQSLRITSAALGFSAIVWWSQGIVLRNRIVELIGRHSYSIYVWHMPIALFWSVLSPMNLGGFALCCSSSIVAGILMSRAVELPVLRWRDKVFPSTRKNVMAHSFNRWSDSSSVVPAVGSQDAA